MDLAMVITRWLAGPIARFLDADGETPQERRAEVIEFAGLPGDDRDDLGLRHVTRGSAWFIFCGVVFVVTMAVAVLVSLVADDRAADLAFEIAGWLIFFPLFMAFVHFAKMLVVRYAPERWSDRKSRLWRVAMLAQTPEYLIAALLTAASALWW
ncbi:hypothetical protein [Micromonospora sp. NPDC126480]|uniref:hypothetical protein n=1 Tax=Micromonospora sp. NPDC126480 TaxID=3155312 RepID=UPI00332D9DE9